LFREAQDGIHIDQHVRWVEHAYLLDHAFSPASASRATSLGDW
jgi:hypothetical protein